MFGLAAAAALAGTTVHASELALRGGDAVRYDAAVSIDGGFMADMAAHVMDMGLFWGGGPGLDDVDEAYTEILEVSGTSAHMRTTISASGTQVISEQEWVSPAISDGELPALVATDLEVGDIISDNYLGILRVTDITKRQYGGETREVFKFEGSYDYDYGGAAGASSSSTLYYDRLTGIMLEADVVITTHTMFGPISITMHQNATEVSLPSPPVGGGGCLIATAAYGSELAPQVQLLREVRDNIVLSVPPGTAFMSVLDPVYYSFSPWVADMERQNPLLRQAVTAMLTPTLYILNVMTLAEPHSEVSVAVFGVLAILLVSGIHVGAPLMAGFWIRRYVRGRLQVDWFNHLGNGRTHHG